MTASTRTSRRRVALAACIALLALVAVPSALAATKSTKVTKATKASCGKQVVNDWFSHSDHSVHGHYPLYCYTEALDSLPTDIDTYTNARTAIQAALAAQALRDGGGGPGGGLGSLRRRGQKPIAFHNTYDFSGVVDASANPSPTTNTAGPSSVPVPLLVLAGLAVLLLTAGGAGYVARKVKGNRGGGGTPAADPADS